MPLRYKLPQGVAISELSVPELKDARDDFMHWVREQPVKMGNAPNAYKHAFDTLIRWNERNPMVLEPEMQEALVALQKGFFYSEKEHQGKHKGGHGR